MRERMLAQIAEEVRRAEAFHRIGRLVSISIGEHSERTIQVVPRE